ncbi:MAG TPA: SsrA-binding protein, partial [Draconibacterium sp.]|nr:SsrA-binding protein [Draconibacterium sp.]
MTHRTSDIKIKNRRVTFEFELIEKWIAGIKLTGTEIKSIRGGKVNLTESYCQFFGGELYVKNMHISEYDFGTHNNHEARRDRKLLLNRKELTKL